MRPYLIQLAALQSQILIGLTYLAVVLPIWLILRLARRSLMDTSAPRWHKPARMDSLDALRLPF